MLVQEALKAVKAQPRPKVGICGNFAGYFTGPSRAYHEAARWLKDAMAQWPGHSGDVVYPVGSMMVYTASCRAGTVWDDPRRHELLDFLIERAERDNV